MDCDVTQSHPLWGLHDLERGYVTINAVSKVSQRPSV